MRIGAIDIQYPFWFSFAPAKPRVDDPCSFASRQRPLGPQLGHQPPAQQTTGSDWYKLYHPQRPLPGSCAATPPSSWKFNRRSTMICAALASGRSVRKSVIVPVTSNVCFFHVLPLKSGGIQDQFLYLSLRKYPRHDVSKSEEQRDAPGFTKARATQGQPLSLPAP